MFSNFFFRKSCRLWENVKKYGRDFKEAIPLCENLEVYIFLRLDTSVVHNLIAN
jgi:hypothetical protein